MTRRLCQILLLIVDLLSCATRGERLKEHPWGGSSSPKASLGKWGEKGSCMVERRAPSSACPPWGTGNLSREGFGVIFGVGGRWFSDLLLCPCGAVLERVGDEILLFKGRRDRVEFPEVGLGMCS